MILYKKGIQKRAEKIKENKIDPWGTYDEVTMCSVYLCVAGLFYSRMCTDLYILLLQLFYSKRSLYLIIYMLEATQMQNNLSIQ